MADNKNVYDDDSCWCQCEEDHDVDFHDDGNSEEYGDNKFECWKHHYACKKCGQLKQIG